MSELPPIATPLSYAPVATDSLRRALLSLIFVITVAPAAAQCLQLLISIMQLLPPFRDTVDRVSFGWSIWLSIPNIALGGWAGWLSIRAMRHGRAGPLRVVCLVLGVCYVVTGLGGFVLEWGWYGHSRVPRWTLVTLLLDNIAWIAAEAAGPITAFVVLKDVH